MKYVKNPDPLTPEEIPGVCRAISLLETELKSPMGRKRRSILNHTRKFFLALTQPEETADAGDAGTSD